MCIRDRSKTDPEVARAMLEAAIPALEGLDGWTTEGIHDALIALAEKLAVKNATLMWPVRIAAAGKAVTPGEMCIRDSHFPVERVCRPVFLCSDRGAGTASEKAADIA